jgi:hypothetical protein
MAVSSFHRNERLTGRVRPVINKAVIVTEFGPREGRAFVVLEVETESDVIHMVDGVQTLDPGQKPFAEWRNASPHDFQDARLKPFLDHGYLVTPPKDTYAKADGHEEHYGDGWDLSLG